MPSSSELTKMGVREYTCADWLARCRRPILREGPTLRASPAKNDHQMGKMGSTSDLMRRTFRHAQDTTLPNLTTSPNETANTMGSAASKTARAAPTRKYPTRATGASPAQNQPRAPRPKARPSQESRPSESSAPEQPSRPSRPREPEPVTAEPAAEAKTDDKGKPFPLNLVYSASC